MDKFYQNILDITHNYYNYLLSLENVNGIGLGYKKINKINTYEPCIHVLVARKVNSKYISTNNIIPSRYMGIKTDVIEASRPKIYSTDEITGKFRPLEGGCNVCVKKDTDGGTLGCIVTKKILFKKKYFILSNNHVIARENKSSIGASIFQPHDFKYDVVARLSNFKKLHFIKENKKVKANYIDAAIAEITRKSLVSNLITKIGKVKGVSTPSLGLKIKKVGCVIGLTFGEIVTIGVTENISFSDGKLAFFQDQILAKLEGDEGDSGAIALNEDNEAVGLIFSGSKVEGLAVMNDINLVLKKFNVKIYTS